MESGKEQITRESVEAVEPFDKTGDLTLDIIKTRAVKGIVTLTGRTFILQIISLVATFLLTVFLDPKQYGVFFIVSAVINFFAYFSDIGLAAALVQKKDNPSRKELETTFVVQNSLVVSLIVIIILATPFLKNWYHLANEATYLLWALSLSLFFSSLKTIPSVLMERRLDFNKLVVPQIVEALLYNLVAVVLAWKGYGVSSFTYAVLIRGLAGLSVIYIIEPWRPGLSFSKESLKSLLKFGLPYQLNAFLAVAKDDGMTAVLGTILGTSGIGLLGWAQKWGTAPLRFFMDQVIKVTFPAYSRMQDNKEELSKAVTKSIFFICLLVFPALGGLVILSPDLTQLIPKYTKWQPALLALALISFNSAWAAVSTPLTNVLNAIGKIKTTFKLMIMWTILTWILVPGFTFLLGINGAALGYSLVGLSSIVAVIVATRLVKINFLESIGKPLLASALMAGVLIFLRLSLPLAWLTMVMMIAAGIATYSLLIFFLVGPQIILDFKKVVSNIKGGR